MDKLTIFIDSKNDAENTFKNIYLKDQVDTQQSKIIFAKTGKLIDVLGVRTLRLYGGVFINVNDNKTTIFNFDKTDFDLSNFGTKSVTYRKIQERDSRSLLSCLSNFYMNNINFVEIPGVCNKDFIIEIKQEIFKRFFKPLYLFVVIMIVSFLLISYRENIIYKSIKSIIFIVAIISLAASEISISYFGRDNFSSIITALIPLLLFLLLYFVLIKKLSFNEIKKQ